MDRRFEQGTNGEPEGLPTDLLTNPEKYEVDLPLWRRTVGLVRQYGHTRPNKKDAVLDQFANPLAKDPKSWKYLIDNFDLLTELGIEGDVDEIKGKIFTRIEVSAARRSNLPSWTPDKIEELVSVGFSTSNELNLLAQRVEVALFSAPRSIEEAVDLRYNTAWAAVATMRPDVREELTSILCYEKSWLTELTLPAFYASFGGSGLTDDKHIKKFYATETAFMALIRFTTLERDGKLALNPIRLQSLGKRISAATLTWPFIVGPKVAAWLIGLEKQQAVRFHRIGQYDRNDPIDQYHKVLVDAYTAGEKRNLFEATEALSKAAELVSNLTWPYDLKHDPNEPLRKMSYDFLAPQVGREAWERTQETKGLSIITARPVQLTEHFSVLMAVQGDLSPEQKSNLVRRVYRDLQARYHNSQQVNSDPFNKAAFQYASLFELGYSGACAVDRRSVNYLILRMLPMESVGKLASVIESYRPAFTLKDMKSIEAQSIALRIELQKGFTRSIGRRGYTLVVSDSYLRHLGYKEITVNQDSSNKTHVQIVIDKENYIFDMDEDYRIVPGGDVKRFVSLQDQVWLELLTLSHLKKLICTEEDEEVIKAELIGGARQYEGFRRQLVSRSEHLRRQSPGRDYTTEAFQKCLKSQLPVKNLFLINRMKAEIDKGGTKETGIWTYVSGTEYTDIPEAKPVRVAFKRAAEGIRAVIPLGEVSPEELTRIEHEILEELGM